MFIHYKDRDVEQLVNREWGDADGYAQDDTFEYLLETLGEVCLIAKGELMPFCDSNLMPTLTSVILCDLDAFCRRVETLHNALRATDIGEPTDASMDSLMLARAMALAIDVRIAVGDRRDAPTHKNGNESGFVRHATRDRKEVR